MGIRGLVCTWVGLIAICFSIGVGSAEERTGTYNTAATNLRVGPSLSSASLGWVNEGATCKILEECTVGEQLWYRVEITSTTVNKVNLKGLEGWSMAEWITEEGTDFGEGELLEESQEDTAMEPDPDEELDLNQGDVAEDQANIETEYDVETDGQFEGVTEEGGYGMNTSLPLTLSSHRLA